METYGNLVKPIETYGNLWNPHDLRNLQISRCSEALPQGVAVAMAEQRLGRCFATGFRRWVETHELSLVNVAIINMVCWGRIIPEQIIKPTFLMRKPTINSNFQ